MSEPRYTAIGTTVFDNVKKEELCAADGARFSTRKARAAEIAAKLEVYDKLVFSLDWTLTHLPKYSRRIVGQNEEWCDGYDVASAVLELAKKAKTP